MSLKYKNSQGTLIDISGLAGNVNVVNTVANNNYNAVTSNAVYNAIQPAFQATFVVKDTSSLNAWKNNTTGNDYSYVYIAPGIYNVNGVISNSNTKRIEGAGKATQLNNVQLQNMSNIANICGYNLCFYQCDNIHDVLVLFDTDSNSIDLESFGFQLNSGWLYIFNGCIQINNIQIYKQASTSGHIYNEVGIAIDCNYISNLNAIFATINGPDDIAVVDFWDAAIDDSGSVYGFKTYAFNTCNNICNCKLHSISGMIAINNCQIVTNNIIYNYITEYGIISNSQLITNNDVVGITNTSDSGGAGHITYLLYGAYNVANNRFWGYNYRQQSETVTNRKMQVGYTSYKVIGNSFYVDNTTTIGAYASATSTYPISDTPNGGFNSVQTSTW